MRAKTTAILSTATALALLTACSDEKPGNPSNGGGNTTEVEGLPHSGAPKVENPIADTSQWEADPCKVLTEGQLKSIGFEVTDTEPFDDGGSPGCDWERRGGGSFNQVDGALLITGEGKGLSNIYAQNDVGAWEYFQELEPIEGYPAVIDLISDDRSEGDCGLAVGLRDDLVYSIGVSLDSEMKQAKDPCGFAVEVARLAVQTMGGS